MLAYEVAETKSNLYDTGTLLYIKTSRIKVNLNILCRQKVTRIFILLIEDACKIPVIVETLALANRHPPSLRGQRMKESCKDSPLCCIFVQTFWNLYD